MSNTKTDAVVIGGGPAGATTAIFLARRGYDVILLDRARFPRDKPCGEYLSPGAVGLLRDELGVLPALQAGGAARLTHEMVVPHNGAAFGGPTEALSCPRVVTDAVLIKAAKEAGVNVWEGFAARRILFAEGAVCGVEGTDSQGNTAAVHARVTVGADGTHSLLARALGVVQPIRRLQRLALVTHYQTAESGPEEGAVVMHLPQDRTDACCGVGAPCGPDGTRNVNIVVPVSESAAMAGRREEYFAERLQRSFPQVWEQVQNAAQVGPLRSVGCFGHHTRRASHSGAVLVGDAATFINPFTGEGVFFALRGAQLAAKSVDEGLRAGCVDGSALRRYDLARKRELLPRYRLCDLVQRVVHSPGWLAWAASRLRRSAPLTDTLLRTIGDLSRPADLLSPSTLRLALSTL